MKKVYFIFLIVSISFLAKSQPWLANIPEEKRISGELTFYEIQKAFNDYWEPFNVVDGYYYQNGEKIKAPYWKQFRRWEWYWENRVNPETGEFPKTSAWEELQKYIKENPGQKSPSGNWTSLGPSATAGGYAGLGRLNCVAFVPTDNNTIYVGAASGGIWKTTNGGLNWTPLGDSNPVLGVSDIIVIRPVSGPDIIYIATGDRDGGSMWSLGGGQYNDNNSVGVLKSTDGGVTWNTTGLSFTASQQRTINRMLLDPTNNNILYAATSVGLYKTTNAGASWTLLTSTNFVDIVFKPGTSSTIYASNWYGDIYRSVNSGTSFSTVHITSNGRVELAVTPHNVNVVYALMDGSNGLGGIYKSTNGGTSFFQVYTGSLNFLGWNCDGSDSGDQGSYDLCIAADPNNVNNVFIGGVNTWRSSDGGVNWSITNHWSGCTGITTVHADQHYLAYQNGTSTLFECNDGGFYKTTNNGLSWTHLGSGLVTSQIYRLGTAQTSSNDVIVGLQDNGTKALLTGTWSDELGGDGFECAYDYNNHNTMYGEIYYGDIRRSTNHGGSWTAISSGITGSAHWCAPFVLDANTSTTLYIGYQDVWRSTNQGTSWTKISNWAGSTIRSLAVTPASSNVICAATQTILYRTANGGATWSNITGSLPVGSGYITYVWIKDTDPNTIWVSLGGYNSFGVYETTDGGSTWTNISTGLPSIPVMCVIQNKLNTTQNELYAGTDVGVYVKIGTSPWSMFFNGLPNVVVTELDIYYDAIPGNSRLRAATYGRGLWESDLYTVAAAPIANFSADDVTPLVGQTVTFTDLSSNIPTSWSWSFNPSTVTYTGGTNANSQNPQVQFNNNGPYTVTLVSTNAIGSDGETKIDYIHAGTPGLWTGLTSTDWNTSSNWHNYLVPQSSEDVTIPAAPANWPTYTGNFAAGTNCRDLTLDGIAEMTVTGDLTISGGRTFTCNANATLRVGGNWNNQGIFNEGSSVVEFFSSTNSIINVPAGGPVYLINDNFNTWPGNWNGDIGTSNGQFNQVTTSNAGGTSPEARFLWQSGTATKRLYYNVLNTSGLSTLTLDFKHMVDDYSGSAYTVKVQYSTDAINWFDAGWSVSPTGNIAATTVSVPLSVAQGVGSPTYYIAFVITGNLYNIDYWYIDDVQLYYITPAGQTFFDLVDNKSAAEVIANGNILLLNDLTVRPGAYFTNATGNTINIQGNLLLEGTSSGKASYIDNGTTNVTGTTIMESYYTDNRWHFISSPVSNAVSNIFLDIYLKHWNETDSTWTYIVAIDSLLRIGQGYEIWSTIGNPTIQYTGTGGILNTGNISPTVTATDQGGNASIDNGEGWNFVGNPYPSAINWGTGNNPVAGYVRTNLDNTIYCWNGTQYATYNPTLNGGDGQGTNGGSQYIQSIQSFFVKANNFSPAFTIPNGARIHSSQANLKSTTVSQFIRLTASGDEGSDEILLEVNEASTPGFDSEFDAYKLWGYDDVPQFYFKMMGLNLSVNVTPEIDFDDVFDLGFKSGTEGIFTVEASQIENFNTFDNIFLEDLKSGTIVNLKENPVYSFTASPQDDSDRFLLKFSDVSSGIDVMAEDMINVYGYQNTIYVQFLSDFESGDLTVYDLLGQEIFRQKINNAEYKTIPVSAETGYYIVAFKSGDQLVVRKVILR